LRAVETADANYLEPAVRDAVNAFVIGCKADGIWTAIKASCILAGARTLAGALVPLVGTAPTNVSFVSGDYNRETGLVGNGSTKYLNSNRNNNADPQNSNHNAVYITGIVNGIAQAYMGAGVADSGANFLGASSSNFTVTRSRSSTAGLGNSAVVHSAGFFANSRASSTSYITRIASANYFSNQTSEAPFNGNILVFARGTTASPGAFASARLAFYSIGESLDLALLDARVTTLIQAIDAAI
jgi:hypothetical protein